MILTTRQLATRWGLSPGTLANWRVQGVGPKYIKLRRTVRYVLKDIEQWELCHKRSAH